MRALLTSLLAISLATGPVRAQEGCTRDAMIVFDGSGSMAEMGFNQIGEPRIFEARRAMRRAMPEVAPVRRLGLIVYGPGGVDGCTGIDLRFPPVEDAADRVIAGVDGVQPEGETALTDAVAMAAEVLDYRNTPGIVVLVTDGRETCGGAPCALANHLAAEAADLTVHVIGFKVRGDFFSWERSGTDYHQAETVARCLAEETGGSYVSAETLDELIGALRVTLGCRLMF